MERSSDTIWRPMPYIAQSYDGSDATSNFADNTQLAVPATIGYQKHSTALLTAKEMRDQLQENRLGSSAAQRSWHLTSTWLFCLLHQTKAQSLLHAALLLAVTLTLLKLMR